MSCINTKFGYHFITVQSTIEFLSSSHNSKILESLAWFLVETDTEPLTSDFFRTRCSAKTVLSCVSSVTLTAELFWLAVLVFVVLTPGWHFTHCTWVYCPIIKEFRMTPERRSGFQRFPLYEENVLEFPVLFQSVPYFYLQLFPYLVQNLTLKQFSSVALPFSFSQRLQVLNEISA